MWIQGLGGPCQRSDTGAFQVTVNPTNKLPRLTQGDVQLKSWANRLCIAIENQLGQIETNVAAIAAAQATATAAGTAAAAAQSDVADIASGDLVLDVINVGGVRFIESGGSLVPEP